MANSSRSSVSWVKRPRATFSASRTSSSASDTDRDYNDYVLTFETQPVPEPGTLLLFGAGMATLVAQRRRAARKARSEATN